MGKWSTGIYARNLNLTIRENGICTTQHLFWRMTNKLIWNFDIQADHIISTRRPDLIIINKNKRTCKIVDLVVLADHRIKLKESEKKDKDVKELKTMEREGEYYANRGWYFWYSHEMIIKGTGVLVNKRMSGDQHYCERPECWEESWWLEVTCYDSNFRERPSANTDVKNSQGVNNRIIMMMIVLLV